MFILTFIIILVVFCKLDGAYKRHNDADGLAMIAFRLCHGFDPHGERVLRAEGALEFLPTLGGFRRNVVVHLLIPR